MCVYCVCGNMIKSRSKVNNHIEHTTNDIGMLISVGLTQAYPNKLCHAVLHVYFR